MLLSTIHWQSTASQQQELLHLPLVAVVVLLLLFDAATASSSFATISKKQDLSNPNPIAGTQPTAESNPWSFC